MEGKEKSNITEAIAEYELIQKLLEENTKEILRSVAKEEITSTLNESLNEDDYDIEDIEDDNGEDVGELPIAADDGEMGAEPEMGMEPEVGDSEELGIDDTEMDPVDGSEDYEAEEGSEDYELDMTAASDEEVISVYKKLSGEDEIEVVSPNEVIITDPVSGAEYDVKLGGGSMLDQGPMDDEGGLEGLEPEMGMEPDMEPEAEMGMEPEMEPEVGAEPEMDGAPDAEVEAEPEMDDAESYEDEDEDDELGEGVVYEIELSEDSEDVAEDIIRGKGHDTELVSTTSPNTGNIGGQKAPTNDGTKAVKPGKGGEAAQSVDQSGPNTGDIEGQNAPKDSKTSGDNLAGGFDDDGENGSGDNHAQHIMEDDGIEEAEAVEEEVETIDEIEESLEEEEAIEEHIPKGQGEAHRLPGKVDIGQPKAPGGKNRNIKEAAAKYNKLLAEAKKLKTENDMFRNSLKDFRKMLGETAVFNSNLTYVTKLFLEHSTTKGEKKEILGRFDNEVGTIEESKKMYKRIVSELSSKSPISESVESKIVGEQTTSQSAQLNETRAYVDPHQSRVMDLIRRTQR